MTQMPALETARLRVRPFVMDDLAEAHRLFAVELGGMDLSDEAGAALAERARWLEWSVLSYEHLAMLHQPPYGDRAIVLKATGQLIGSVGFVACLMPFEQLPYFAKDDLLLGPSRSTPEFGLFWAIAPAHQREGYATEAARAMVDYAFQELGLKRVVATTEYGNLASIGVMRKLGMWIERNPLPEPPWLQVVGVLEYSLSAPHPY
jgi:RimJ/RimL family protein N-acetyltransferase